MIRIVGSTGPVQKTAAELGPATAVTLAGAAGAVPGMTVFEGADGGPEDPFVAVTVNEYAVPLVSAGIQHS